MDLTHLTDDEKINGIRATNVPKHIRDKVHGQDVRETLAQLAEMIIQLGVNLSLDPDQTLDWARKLQQALPQSEFDSWVATLLDGGPSIFMNTLNELKTTYPNGAAGVALVRETDPAKIYVWNGSTWENFGDYQGIEIKDKSVTEEKIAEGAVTDSKISTETNLIFKKPGKNILDENNIIADDMYVNYITGNLLAGVGNRVVSVPVEENTEYTLSNRSVTNASLQQLAFYNADGMYISGISNAGVKIKATYTTPNGAVEMKLTVNKTQQGKIQLEKGFLMTAYEPYILKLPNGVIDKKYTNYLESVTKKILTVKADGSGDFKELRLALEATSDASETNQYEVHIEEGTYDVRTMYSQSEFEISSFKGLTIPDYVSLVSIGKKENTIITLTTPESYGNSTIMRVATIANMGNGDLKNLTVIGSNVRYTIHDDYAYPDAIKRIKNCTFIKKDSLGNSQAWGEGTGSGMEFYFEDVEFITEHNQASYSSHNNLAHEKPTKHVFKNCKFKNNGGYYGVRFITLNSGQTEKVDMIDCYVEGVVKFEEYETGVGNRYDFNMYGMADVKVAIDATDGSQPVYLSNLETLRAYNAESTATITKGTPVMLNNDGSSILKLGDNDISLIVGIAMQDILPGEIGVIKTSGYLPVPMTGLTLVKGDKVGVASGALAKVTTSDYVAIANQRDFVRLKF